MGDGSPIGSHSTTADYATTLASKYGDKHCGLWQASAPRAPPDMDDLVLELDAAYSASSINSTDQSAEPQDLTYVDIDTFLAGF
jgi:hypothetical protein